MGSVNNQADALLDAALALAEERSWEAVRLHDVAEAAGVPLVEISRHYREKEDLVDAWFDRADRAMLLCADTPGFQDLGTAERIERLIMTWLGALSAHRRVTRQMIVGKLEPGHLHIQIPAIMRISRTVQWVREAAHRDATHVMRALEETALTSIYLMTFLRWMADASQGSAETRRFLRRMLGFAERASHTPRGTPSSRPGPRERPEPAQQEATSPSTKA